MNNSRRLVMIGLFGGLMGLISQLSLPLPGGVPVTLQVFAAALTGYLLGALSGTVSVAVWLTLGALGLPLFSGFQGGVSRLFCPTGGFLMGFLILAFFCGIARKRSRFLRWGMGLLGLLLCHGWGVLWFCIVGNVAFVPGALTASLPYFPKDCLLLLGADFCAGLLLRRVPSLRE
jgi:biotin transport system substrate-specific component